MPRRYRGQDLIWWLSALGLDQTPVHKRGPDRSLPLITGAYGGHTIDFRHFAAQGITLLGRIRALNRGTVHVAPDLAQSLALGDAAYAAFLDMADAHVSRHGLDMPQEPDARHVRPDPACLRNPLCHLDIAACDISAVIWATGYGVDFGWIQAPIFDARGEPLHLGGVTEVPGLYFLGLQWLSKMNSSFLAGIGDDAARLADHIAARATEQDCPQMDGATTESNPRHRPARNLLHSQASS
jgi:putative flavoprotein involved in K+ transport